MPYHSYWKDFLSRFKPKSSQSTPVDAAQDVQETQPIEVSVQNRQFSKYAAGEFHKGVISGIEDYGIFIIMPNGESGLVYQTEIAWAGEDPVSYRVGNLVDVKVLSFKPGQGLALSLRQTRIKSSFDKFIAANPVGSVTCGSIQSVVKFGVFVTVAPGIKGLVHISNLRDIQQFQYHSIGKPINVRVINISPEKSRISLELA